MYTYKNFILTSIALVFLCVVVVSAHVRTPKLMQTKGQTLPQTTATSSPMTYPLGGWNMQTFTSTVKAMQIQKLSKDSYSVTQENATDIPYHNAYFDNEEKGIYVDIVSGEPLFLSSDKYDSGTGWPSFTKTITPDTVTYVVDNELGIPRTEVRSKIANSHVGHVFDDGPQDRGGKRYCMNSSALYFIPLSNMEKAGYGQYMK